MPDIAYMAVPFAYPNFPVPGLSVKGAAGGIGGEYLGLEGPVAFRLRNGGKAIQECEAFFGMQFQCGKAMFFQGFFGRHFYITLPEFTFANEW